MGNSLVLKYLERKPKILEYSSTLRGMTKPSPLSIISRNIAALRNAHGWSQGELAKKAGVSQKVISNLENAETLGIHPTIHTIALVADALGMSLIVLMTPFDSDQIRMMKDPELPKLMNAWMHLSPDVKSAVSTIIYKGVSDERFTATPQPPAPAPDQRIGLDRRTGRRRPRVTVTPPPHIYDTVSRLE